MEEVCEVWRLLGLGRNMKLPAKINFSSSPKSSTRKGQSLFVYEVFRISRGSRLGIFQHIVFLKSFFRTKAIKSVKNALSFGRRKSCEEKQSLFSRSRESSVEEMFNIDFNNHYRDST